MFENILGTKNFTGKHMLGVLFLFFGTIIAVNLVMATYAVTTWTGLVVKDDFGASQHYNEKLDAMRKQAALGWSGELNYGNELISFRLRDKDKQAITDATVKVKVARPTHEGADRTITLSRGPIDDYAASLKLMPGIWNVEIDVRGAHDESYQQRVRLYVRG
jgi:nitrogen fixation protein FixH